MQPPSSPSASSASPAEIESVGIYALLDFLTGNSIDDVTRRHQLRSRIDTERIIRAMLLLHGYDAEGRGAP